MVSRRTDDIASCPQCNDRDTESRRNRSTTNNGASSNRRRDRRRNRTRTSRTTRSRSSRSSRASRRTTSTPTSPTSAPVTPEEEAQRSQVSDWPHSFSFFFACLSCTVGVYNISRFAILTIDFGAIFVVQFLLLSLLFGIPLMVFYVSLGQYLGSGVVDMWRITPIFQGVGVALMLSQGILGTYGIATVSWLFVYFRDSFITSYDHYRWSLCHPEPAYQRTCEADYFNNTLRLEESLPDYFASTVLRRATPAYPNSTLGHLKFQTVFNMAVVWMVIFIGLSKGLRSYGKVVYGFGILPVVGFLVFATKVLGLLQFATFQQWFFDTQWADFLYNAKSWVCSARECFLTWSLLGASMLQLSSHNRFRHRLIRDTTLVTLVTLVILVLSGLVGIACNNIIASSGYEYQASSFETHKSYEFLSSRMRSGSAESDRSSSALKSFDPSDREHVSFVAGIRIIQPGRDTERYSGYQVMRLATEIVPAYASILRPSYLNPFWVIVFYFSMILFGLAQQMALWHTVVCGLIAIKPGTLKKWQTCITFSCCVFGFILGLPMATEISEFVLYFLDYTLGCGWWLMLLYLLQLFAVFVVRGRPYSGENVATVLFPKKACGSSVITPVVAFTWNVVLPIGLLILSIISFKTGHFSEMFDWRASSGYVYLPSWVREIGAMLQLMPLLLVPFVAIIQSCRYFLNGPEDLYDRIHLLYRPSYSAHSRGLRSRPRNPEVVLTNYSPASSTTAIDDPPPKYTPPPSYSTATGAGIARFLRQSFRQSIRRLRGETGRPSPSVPVGGARRKESDDPKPPDYATVIIETSRHTQLPGLYHETTVTSSEYDDAPMELLPTASAAGHSRQSSSASTTLTIASELMSNFSFGPARLGSSHLGSSHLGSLPVHDRSLGRSTVRSLSFRRDSPIRRDPSPLLRVDGEAVLVESAEPIDSISRSTEEEEEGPYSTPVEAINESSTDDVIVLGGNEEAPSVEARNLNIVIPTDQAGRQNEIITLQIDTSASVI